MRKFTIRMGIYHFCRTDGRNKRLNYNGPAYRSQRFEQLNLGQIIVMMLQYYTILANILLVCFVARPHSEWMCKNYVAG